MKDKRFEYFEVGESSNFPTLELKLPDEFAKLAEEFKLRYLFYTNPEPGATESYFVFLHEQVIYRIKRQGFATLCDQIDAIANGFPSAGLFYKAQQAEFQTYKEYREFEETGITDRSQYHRAKKLGFIDNFSDFTSRMKEKQQLLPENITPGTFPNPVHVFEFAISHGFKDYGDFQKAFFLGFADRSMYDDAQRKGFSNAADYQKASRAGFDNYKEFNEAASLKIESKDEYMQYLSLKKLSCGKFAFDEAELLQKLVSVEVGRKLSLNKLSDMVEEIVGVYKKPVSVFGKKELPAWYTHKLVNRVSIKKFMQENKVLEQFGVFDMEGEYYHSLPFSCKTIYIDGANVAYAANGNRRAAPHYKNLFLLILKLKYLRYKEITIIADASLRHRVDDEQVLKMIEKDAVYLESPSNTTADEFLISKIKKEKGYLITNDTFKDWKLKDPWVAQYIDEMRVPFMITGEKVSIPILERENETKLSVSIAG